MMTYRRTWFSCVPWFLYTALCVILIAVEGDIWIQYLTGISAVRPRVLYVLLVIPAAILYWIIRSIAAWIRKKHVWKKHTAVILECVAFLLIMAGALLIRVISLNYTSSELAGFRGLNINIFPESSMEYYNMAVVTKDGFTAPMDYGISDLYVMILSIVLSFLGNREVSAVFLQVVLQIIGMVLLYAATRKAAGRLPACVAILYFACSKACISMLVYFGPEWLYFVLYMAGMLISVSFVKAYCANCIPKPLAVIGAVVIGAVIGGLTYLDLTAVSLLIVFLTAAVGKKRRQEDAPVRNSAIISAIVIWMAFIACAAVWFGTMDAVSYVKGTNLYSGVMDRLRACYNSSYFFTGRNPYYYDTYLIGVLIVPACFLVFEYFRSGREQNYMPWILLCLIVAPTPLTLYGEHGFGVLSLYIWAVLAGLGLQNCIFGGRAKVMQAMIEGINTAAKKAVESEQAVGVQAAAGAQEEESMKNRTVKPTYIENPLPLPKKHEKREMDYQYDVEEKDMKYDVDVPLNDDFDVK